MKYVMPEDHKGLLRAILRELVLQREPAMVFVLPEGELDDEEAMSSTTAPQS